MAGFVMRKNQRFKELVPVQYRGEGIDGEGMLKDLSLNGGSITGTVPVRTGMALGLHMFVPGDPEPLLIGRAVVKWVKGMEFGVNLTPNATSLSASPNSSRRRSRHTINRHPVEHKANGCWRFQNLEGGGSLVVDRSHLR